MAAAVSADPDVALRVHTREELGLDHTDLPSAVLAGGASLAAFSVGAVLPLLPYLIGRASLLAAMLITAVALISGGAVVGRLTGRPLPRSAGRQLLLGPEFDRGDGHMATDTGSQDSQQGGGEGPDDQARRRDQAGRQRDTAAGRRDDRSARRDEAAQLRDEQARLRSSRHHYASADSQTSAGDDVYVAHSEQHNSHKR